MVGQQSVNIEMAAGFPGQPYLSGPHRAQPGTIVSAGTSHPNYVGYAYTYSSDGNCTLGGSGVFYGILVNPGNYPLYGTSSGALAPTLALPQYSPGEFMYDTTGIWVELGAAANVGDNVYYDTTTGAIGSQAPAILIAGAQRIAYASNVATVSLTPAGTPPLQIDSVITTADGQVTAITSLGTGTGGNGTYNVGTVTNASAQAFGATKLAAPSGKLFIPGWSVLRFTLAGAGLGLIGTKLS